MRVRVKKLREGAALPAYNDSDDSGADLRACEAVIPDVRVIPQTHRVYGAL